MNDTLARPDNKIKGDNEVNQILKRLFAYYRNRESKLIYLLYRKGVTQEAIARELGVAPKALSINFPKGKVDYEA